MRTMPISTDATGVTVPSLSEISSEKLAQLQTIFGADLTLADQTPQAQLAGILTVPSIEFGEALLAAVAGVHLDTATGAQLDALGSLLMIARRAATRSTVVATLTGVAGTVVPTRSRAATSDGDTFETITEATLTTSGVTVRMQATTAGVVAAAAGSLTRIVTVVAGWESVTNTDAASVGAATQTDAEYRVALRQRAARTSVGPMAALQAALEDADADSYRTAENATGTADVMQEWTLLPYSILVVVSGGTDSDLRRAVEYHKGMGVAITVAIFGGAPNETTLAGITDGQIEWNGTEYDMLDLSATTTQAERAAALTVLLAADPIPPTVTVIDGRYVAVHAWKPNQTPAFAQTAVPEAFGLDPAAASAPPGPFVRPRDRELTVTLAVTRTEGFPADGLDRIRSAVADRVNGYALGETLWPNDLLVAAETIPGTRVTTLAVQHDSATLTGATTPPFDARWTLPAANLTITIT